MAKDKTAPVGVIEWDEEMAQGLEDLRHLVRLVSMLDSGSNFLNKAATAIEIAERLDRWSADRKRASFVYRLERSLVEAEAKSAKVEGS